jgi:hypothetical protein
MRKITDRGAKGQEAPMVISPRDVVRLLRQLAGVMRRKPRRDAS